MSLYAATGSRTQCRGFKAPKVFIRRDAATGDIVLSVRPAQGSWAEFLALRARTRVPADFLADRPLNGVEALRDPLSAAPRAELLFGLEKRDNPKALSRLVHAFIDRVLTQPWDAAAADRFARLRARLERAGTPIGVFDTMIAAHALSLAAVLITSNRKHFARVPGLRFANWAE